MKINKPVLYSIASAICLTLFPTMLFAQGGGAPLNIRYELPGEFIETNLSAAELAAAPKECIVDFRFSGPTARIIMESLNGQVIYKDQVYPLAVQSFPDSTYVYGKPGSWTIGLGYFENIPEFRVRLVNANAQGQVQPTIAQGTYP